MTEDDRNGDLDDDDVADGDLDGGDGGATAEGPDLAALGLGGLAGGGLPDLGGMMDGLAKMQAVQDEVFEGSAGGGLVRIRANGRFEIESVTIEPDALADTDAELLADLVHAALRDLTGRIAAAQQEAMGPLGGLLG
jgi:nucleoid-associated protein EbfC